MSRHTTEMKMVSTAKLIPYVNNARTHSQEQVNKLRGSLREFGFINPIIIDADYNVIWASEIEPFPVRVTEVRFPNVKHYGDIVL